MRILFLAHRIPYPPDKGDKIRSFHELRGLVARGHEVHLLAFADDPQDMPHEAALSKMCASVCIVRLDRRQAHARSLAGLLGSTPLSVRYFASGAMRRYVQRALARIQPDALVVYSSPMTQYVPARLAPRTIVDLVDVDSEKWGEYASSRPAPLSWLYTIESRRLRSHESAILTRFAHSIVSTDREARLLHAQAHACGAASRLHTATNGVDLDRYRADVLPDARGSVPTRERAFLADRSVRRVVFTGTMDYHPNVDAVRYFVDDIWPRIRASQPRTEFLIVGRNPPACVRRLSDVPGVRVTGEVADIRPYLLLADVAVVPLRIARGIQNKVLEAMAIGCPVVATAEGAAGLSVVPGEHLLLGAMPADIAAAVLAILRDARLRVRLQAAARTFVERHHEWAPTAAKLADLVEEVGATRIPS